MKRQSKPVSKRKCIFVLGMHRSGTSAFSGVLHTIGFNVGTKLMPANEHNVAGYFEDLDVCAVNDRILAINGMNWQSLSTSVLSNNDHLQHEIADLIIRKFDRSKTLVLKDPRFSLTLPIWKAACRMQGIDCYAVVALRHPSEVSDSLRRRNGFTSAKSLLLWANYSINAERHTRDLKRMFVHYPDFLENPLNSIRALFRLTGINKPIGRATAKKISEFVDPSLKHHKLPVGAVTEPFPWVGKLFEALRTNSKQKTLEAIYLSFGKTLEEYYSPDVAKSLVSNQAIASTLFFNTGNGFNKNEKIEVHCNFQFQDFVVQFSFPKKLTSLKSIRWDPLEDRFIRLLINSIEITRSDKTKYHGAIENLRYKGPVAGDGSVEYNTLDPQVEMDVEPDIVEITFSGKLWFLEQRRVVKRLHESINTMRNQVQEAQNLNNTITKEQMTQLADVRKQIQELSGLLNEKVTQNQKEAQQDLSVMRKELDHLRTTLKDNSESVSAENGRLRDALELARKEKNSLLERLSKKNEELTDQKVQVAELKASIANAAERAVAEKQELLRRISQNQEVLDQRRQEIESLSNRALKERKALLEELEKQRDELTRVRAVYANEVDGITKDKEALSASVATIAAELDNTKIALNAAREESARANATLTSERESWLRQIKREQAAFESLRIQFETQSAVAIEEAKALLQQMEAKDEEIGQLYEAVENEKKAFSDAASRNIELSEKIKSLERQFSNNLAENAALVREVHAKKDEVLALKKAIEQSATERNLLLDKLNGRSRDIESLEKIVRTLSVDLHQSKRKYAEKTEELEFYKAIFNETPRSARHKWIKRALYRLDRFFTNEVFLPSTYLLNKLVFDPEYYIKANPELKDQLGTDREKSEAHWLKVGVIQGLAASKTFHVKYYLDTHQDLKKWYKVDYKGAIKHWLEHGIAEGRRASPDGTKATIEDLRKSQAEADTPVIQLPKVKDSNLLPPLSTPAPLHSTPQKSGIRRRFSSWDWGAEKNFKGRLKEIEYQHFGYFDRIRVSVIMPVYNRRGPVCRAIASVLAQSFTNWELIVIDDGSTDGTLEAVEPFASDRRIRMHRNAHAGVAAARNTGLEVATGDYIFYLDSDNEWEPDYLKNMIIFMEAGGLGAAYCGLRIVDDDYQTQGFRGDRFAWIECHKQNYVDMNCFGHRRFTSVRHEFDLSLRRLVDWDFILRVTFNTTTSFAPFCGVAYYDGRTGSRITHSEYLNDELPEIEKRIRQKLDPKSRQAGTDLQPLWDAALRDAEERIVNDQHSRRFVRLSETLINWNQLAYRKQTENLVSIVILCFNNSAMTLNCIKSILSKSTSEKYRIEIIAVDNGSTDDTSDVLNALALGDDRVRFFTMNENLMFSLGNNIGLAEVRGEYAVFLNNDTLVNEGWLDALIDPLRLDTTIGVTGPKLLYPDDTLQCGGLAFSPKSKIPYHIYRGYRRDDVAVSKARTFQALTGACVALRTSEAIQLKGFDPVFINGCEDLDLCFRVRSVLRKQCLYTPASEIYHLESKSEGRGRFISRNRERFVSRWRAMVRADDHEIYTADGFAVKGYLKPGREPHGETASYVPDIEKVRASANGHKGILNVGFSTIWHARGISYHTKQLAEALDGKSFQCHIFARWESDKFSNNGAIHYPRVYNAGDDPSEAVITDWIKKHQIDVMIFMEVHPKDWKRVDAVKAMGIPVICYENMDVLRRYHIHRYAIFDLFLFNCFHARDYFHSLFPDSKSLIVPWGANPAMHPANVGSNPVRFVHIAGWGGINNRKNTDLLIKAFHAAEVPEAELHIYTQSPIDTYGEDVTAICRNSPNIIIKEGTVEDISEAYENKSMLLWPAKRDGVGLPILEALCRGLPVLIADGYMMKQWFWPECHGLVCPALPKPGPMALPEMIVETDALADTIKRVVRNPEVLVAMQDSVANCRRYWEWSWQPKVLQNELRAFVNNSNYRPAGDLSYLPKEVLEFEHQRRIGGSNGRLAQIMLSQYARQAAKTHNAQVDVPTD